jgi:predicted RNA binding protein YcfA (HicA-like mRNA interferase family)
MPKLPAIKPKDLIRRLEKMGFIIDHQTGSHVVMYTESNHKRAVVPIHLKELPKGTLLAILRESGLSKDDI